MSMQPTYFDRRFGWIHQPDPTLGDPIALSSVGVVICSALAQEEICTHYGVVHLCESLAKAGMSTLRFDYNGTGNSDAVPRSLDGFVDDVLLGAEHLRVRTGVRHIVLLGVRLGGMIAALAAQQMPSAALVLLAPVVLGKAFLRETRMAAKVSSLSTYNPVPDVGSDEPLNTNGFWWTSALQSQIGIVDLMQCNVPVQPVLVFATRGDRRCDNFVESWRQAGIPVTASPFTDYAAWMQDPTTSTVPSNTIIAVRGWLEEHAMGRHPSQALPVRIAPRRVDRLTSADFIEEPHCFGPNQALFGILCRPSHSPGNPIAALLIHEGSSHHIGNGGAYVSLARRLARAGIASLRLDLSGMGDSLADIDRRHIHTDPRCVEEAMAGMQFLADQGFQKAIVSGLCSGAYIGLHVSAKDPRIVGSVLVNLQKFIVAEGEEVKMAVRTHKRSLKAYLRALRNGGEWQRVLRGDADLLGTARVLIVRILRRSLDVMTHLLPPSPDSDTAKAYALMRDLAKRKVHSHLIYSDDDPGLEDLTRHFGRAARRMSHFSPARVTFLTHADHHFNATKTRFAYYDLVLQAFRDTTSSHAPPHGLKDVASSGNGGPRASYSRPGASTG
ncbi:alpha/beta fold hydrolase [Robbsia andropogonis]|uniref:alpha/beta fold hydrolase n=1 Tax=Robbsia andropogonis TaxID=28092 RepID=UPI0004630B88|nr:alpha/beta fold hydrolase [Robbsia andropogonis]